LGAKLSVMQFSKADDWNPLVGCCSDRRRANAGFAHALHHAARASHIRLSLLPEFDRRATMDGNSEWFGADESRCGQQVVGSQRGRTELRILVHRIAGLAGSDGLLRLTTGCTVASLAFANGAESPSSARTAFTTSPAIPAAPARNVAWPSPPHPTRRLKQKSPLACMSIAVHL